MDRSEVLDKVATIIADSLGCDKASITETTSITGDLNADSLDGLELLTAMEDEFGITIDDDQLPSMDIVGNIIDTIIAAQ